MASIYRLLILLFLTEVNELDDKNFQLGYVTVRTS